MVKSKDSILTDGKENTHRPLKKYVWWLSGVKSWFIDRNTILILIFIENKQLSVKIYVSFFRQYI